MAKPTSDDSSSSNLVWMLVALSCGIMILLGAGIFTASRVIRVMQLRAMGSRVSLRTPAGDFRVQKPNEVGPALPVYPDASLVLPQGDIRSAIAESKKDDVETATYHANVSSDLVDSWYSEHLSREFVRNDATVRPRPEVLRRAGVPDNDIAFIGERDHQIRIVDIAQDPAGTDITLLHFAK
jgi:hypothetical protein